MLRRRAKRVCGRRFEGQAIRSRDEGEDAEHFEELCGVDGLDQVVVAEGVEGVEDVSGLFERGGHDDLGAVGGEGAGGGFGFADVLEGFAAVHDGHHDVHGDEVVGEASFLGGGEGGDGLLAVDGDVALAESGEDGFEQEPTGEIVFDDEAFHGLLPFWRSGSFGLREVIGQGWGLLRMASFRGGSRGWEFAETVSFFGGTVFKSFRMKCLRVVTESTTAGISWMVPCLDCGG